MGKKMGSYERQKYNGYVGFQIEQSIKDEIDLLNEKHNVKLHISKICRDALEKELRKYQEILNIRKD